MKVIQDAYDPTLGLADPPTPAKPTHILITHRSQDACMLFRADTGILCCMRQEKVVVFGDSPRVKDSLTFIDNEAAARWIKEVFPKHDLKSLKKEDVEPVIEERNGEAHGLYVPDGSLELPGMGPHISKRAN